MPEVGHSKSDGNNTSESTARRRDRTLLNLLKTPPRAHDSEQKKRPGSTGPAKAGKKVKKGARAGAR